MLSVQCGIESSAGGFGCGNDLVEALITSQIIPARIEAQIAAGWASRDLRDNFELLERGVPCTRAPYFPYGEAATSVRGRRRFSRSADHHAADLKTASVSIGHSDQRLQTAARSRSNLASQ